MRETYVVAYDIADPGRLARVARVCEDHGDRIQKSVFECFLSPSDLIRLRARLGDEIDRAADQVLIVRLGDVAGRVEAIGKPYESVERVAVVL